MFPTIVGLAAQTAEGTSESWLSENSTLIVGVVGIVISGLVGPSVTAAWAACRERHKDIRALNVARRDDLRSVIDEAAVALGGAVAALRPLLAAQLAGEPLPKEPRDFLSGLVLIGQRLRLRLSGDDEVFVRYDEARKKLSAVSEALESQDAFDASVVKFEIARDEFLDAGRRTLEALISGGGGAE